MDYVSTEDGTGIVHTAPAFGERLSVRPQIQPRGAVARLMKEANIPKPLGRVSFVMEDGLDVDIIKYLAEGDKIYKKKN